MARRGDRHQQLGVVRVRPVAFAILDADELFERCGGRGEVPADDTAGAACRSPATGQLVRPETVLVEVVAEVAQHTGDAFVVRHQPTSEESRIGRACVSTCRSRGVWYA